MRCKELSRKYESVSYSESSYRESNNETMTARKEWRKDETFKLITMYEVNTILWNTKDLDYKNKEKKNKTLRQISTHFQCSVEEVQRKIHNLRNQMSQELKKTSKKKSGNGIDKMNGSNWPYFASLKFLIPIFSKDATQATCTQSSMTIEEKTTREEEDTSADNEKNEDRIKEPTQLPRKRKREDDFDEKLYSSVLKFFLKEPDDFDKFGQYVALELKSLKSDFNKAKLKSEIRKVIVRIADEDMYNNVSSTSSASTPMASPTVRSETVLNQSILP